MVDGAVTHNVASTPMFLGSNPADVRDGEQKGQRVLDDEEDAGRALRARAARRSAEAGDRQSGRARRHPDDEQERHHAAAGSRRGVSARWRDSSRRCSTKLIEAYTSNMETDVAAERMANIKNAGLDKVRFAWLGETEKGKKHYYRMQGPTFLIEYDNTQNDGNHVHSVWRDFNGDFGRDILREHLKEVRH